jgi:translation initiation factor 5A
MSISKRQSNSLKKGNYFIPEGEHEPFLVLSIEHSKSGKHGHAKNRIECIGLFNKKKKSITNPADDMVDVPEIVKKQGQMISVNKNDQVAQVMNFEDSTVYDVDYPLDPDEVDVFKKLEQLEQDQDLCSVATCEYWETMGKKFLTRVSIEKP